jgi:hypothetical protein
MLKRQISVKDAAVVPDPGMSADSKRPRMSCGVLVSEHCQT